MGFSIKKAGLATSLAMLLSAAPAAFAAGGGGGGGGGGGTPVPPAARCASLAITNNPQTVRNYVMPAIKYNLENCGTDALAVTVRVTEAPGFLSVICPSPVAAPVQYTLAFKQKLSATAPVYRGPCGEVGPSNQTVVPSIFAWQGHNLLLTVTDDSTGAVLGSSMFSWQDSTPRV